MNYVLIFWIVFVTILHRLEIILHLFLWSLPMETSDIIAIVAAVIALFSMFATVLQIRYNIKLNRKNHTFDKIGELEKLLYSYDSPWKEIIKEIGVINDQMSVLEYSEVAEIYENEEKRNIVYAILNFFESLSLAVFTKNIDGRILKKIYGKRIHRAFIKLHPFITLIAANYHDPKYKPYQHFERLFIKWDKSYGGKNK